MDDRGPTRTGVARLDGLLEVGFTSGPDLETEIDDALKRLAGSCPVLLNVNREPGSISIMPDTSPVPFQESDPPSRRMLPEVRELVETIRRRTECRVESSLRIQEFLGDRVMEGVFVYGEEGITVAARDREAQAGEAPPLPEPTLGDRAESFVRKHQWPLLIVAAAIVIVGVLGWRLGWWGIGAGSVEGPKIDAGPLAGIVEFTKVRWRKDGLIFEMRPGPSFDRFPEVARSCSLRDGVFRVLFLKEGAPTGEVLPLDLTRLPERAAKLEGDEVLVLKLPYEGKGFDEVWICR